MSGYVYFARGTISGLIKIGWAKDPESRIKGFQTGSAEPLELLAMRGGSRELEAAYHKVFSTARIRGEWFWPLPMLCEAIGCRSLGRYFPAHVGNIDMMKAAIERGFRPADAEPWWSWVVEDLDVDVPSQTLPC